MSRPSADRSPLRALPAWRRRLIGGYLELRVIPVLLWSFSAVALGTALAWRDSPGQSLWFVAAVAIGVLLQGVVAHCVNEVADWRSGTDRDPAPRLLSGGSKVVRAGLLSERELTWMGIGAGTVAAVLGLLVVADRGWWLLGLGAIGLAGAVAYTLPPLAAAYTPFAGEAVAFVCVGACALGGFGVQRNAVSGDVVLVGVAHAAYCISMLMLHHYLDRGPDERARPSKVTTVVRLGRLAQRYGMAWALLAAVTGVGAAIAVDGRLLPLAIACVLGAIVHWRVEPDDPGSVTRAEATVIGAGIAGAIASSVWMAPELGWIVAIPAVLVPLELAIARRWLGPGTDGISDNDVFGYRT